jgi:hypothetical protein
VQVAGVSADDAVQLVSGDEVIATAPVAAHGYFVLTAILPANAEVELHAA